MIEDVGIILFPDLLDSVAEIENAVNEAVQAFRNVLVSHRLDKEVVIFDGILLKDSCNKCIDGVINVKKDNMGIDRVMIMIGQLDLTEK